MPETKPTRNEQIVNLRVFATLVVVLGHCIIIFDPSWSASFGFHHQYDCHTAVLIKRFINLFQMELFFVISGICFGYDKSNTVGPLNFVKKKFYRLIIPFIAIAFIWLLPIRIAINFPRYESLSFFEIVYNILTVRDAGHLWFLPVLFNIFIISFSLRLCSEKKWLVIFFAFALFLLHFKIASFIIRQTCYYFLFFSIGNVIDLTAATHRKRTLIAIGAFLLVLVCAFFDFESSRFRVIETMLIVLFIFAIIPHRTNSIIARIDRSSFGIYLFHSPILLFGMTFLTSYPPPLLHFNTIFNGHNSLHWSHQYCQTE